MKRNFKLICKAGSYEAPTFTRLILMVLQHRFWHLRKDGKWID